ncbi:MAG: GTP cyclohydrolase I FolE2 [Candidatus Odinarchaeota archaeon]|nr:GTP cyclohydrolase I FolE2 [Candidatus Odinarchaeota archaeon]
MRDVHDEAPEYRVYLNKVGIKNIKEYATLDDGKDKYRIPLSVSFYLSLPSSVRGIHTSRIVRVLNSFFSGNMLRLEVLDESLGELVRSLMETHPKSEKAILELKMELPKRMFDDKFKGETFKAIFRVTYKKDRGINRYIGLSDVAVTACPCASKELEGKFEKILNLSALREKLPIATHTQRCIVRMIIQRKERDHLDVGKLLRLVEKSSSSYVLDELNRKREAKLILHALRNEKFSEDVVRNVVGKLREMGIRGVWAYVSAESLESFHNFNLKAVFKGIL